MQQQTQNVFLLLEKYVVVFNLICSTLYQYMLHFRLQLVDYENLNSINFLINFEKKNPLIYKHVKPLHNLRL